MSGLPEAAFHRATVERQPADLSNGGLILLLLGQGEACPSAYELHGQVRPILGSDIRGGRDLDAHIPRNTKIVIFQGRMGDARVFKGIHDVLKRRRLPYLIRNNAEAVSTAIEGLLQGKNAKPEPPTPTLGDVAKAPLEEAKRTIAAKGAIKGFIEEHAPDLLKAEPQITNAEAGRKLFRIAQDKAISTTVHSLEQAVRIWRKDHRYAERPESIKTDEQKTIGGIEEAIDLTEQALKRMKAIKGLYLEQREQLQAANTEIAVLKKKVAKAAEVFEAFREDLEA